MEYKKELTRPLITAPPPKEEKRGDASTELEIQDRIDIWVDKHMKDFLNKPIFCYWATTTVEVKWSQVDTPGLEARLREYYVKKLQLVYKENKTAIDTIQQKLRVTQKGVELGLVIYVSNELFVDNCMNAVKRFFRLSEKTPIYNTLS